MISAFDKTYFFGFFPIVMKSPIYKFLTISCFNKNILNESTLDIKDISNLSKFPNLSLKEKKYFIIHHTAGRGTAEDIVNILNTRKNKNGKPIILGIQYIIDRDGNVYRGTKGSKLLIYLLSVKIELFSLSTKI